MVLRRGHDLLALTLLLALPACNGGGPQLTSGGDCPKGSAGCPCDGEKCYGDLECLGNICINPNGDDDGPSPSSEPGTSEPPTGEPPTSEPLTGDPATTGLVTTDPSTTTAVAQTSGDGTTGGATTRDPDTSSSTGAVMPGTTTTGEPETSTTLVDSTGPLDTTGPPEDPGLPEGSMCDIFVQDCAAGLKCMPYGNNGGTWNDSICSKIAVNPDEIGETCSVVGKSTSGKDSCEADSMCFNVPAGKLDGGTCTAFCNGTPQAPTCDDPATSCMINNGGFLSLCLPKCDPLIVDCKVGQICIPNSAQGTFVCAVDVSKGAGQGVACTAVNGCAPHFICITGTYVQGCVKNSCCTAVCDTDLANTCAGMPAVSCRPFFSPGKAKPGYEDVGFCGIP